MRHGILSRRFSAVLALSVATGVAALDQVSKAWAGRVLDGGPPVVVFESWFRLVYHRNTGGVFGLGAGPASLGRKAFFIVATLVALVFIAHLLRQWGRRSLAALMGLSLVAGGAVGNLVDRIAYGEVIDFIDWHWRGHHWPTFNVADSAITVGAALLLAFTLFTRTPPGDEGA